MRKYIEYKDELAGGSKSGAEEQEKIVNRIVGEELAKEGYLSSNVIFYGVPGCGKSHHVNELLHIGKKFEEDGASLDKKFYKRILFHPEYSYSDFIGQIVPHTYKDKITYEFRAGPFVEILKAALEDEDNNYFLIIEEINRGNAPAIFGDTFQLLDRLDVDDDEEYGGRSEYPVYNREIIEYLNKKEVSKEDAEGSDDTEEEKCSVEEDSTLYKEVYIPGNLTVLATMNTSDQNVFTLDTAFKRRWRMTRIKNDFANSADKILDKNNKIDGKPYSWREFAEALNDAILNRCNDGMVAEDKLLGTHFVKQSEIKNIRAFAEKIFMYLWNDVVKYDKNKLFRDGYKKLDDVISDFIEGKKNVFNFTIQQAEEVVSTVDNAQPDAGSADADVENLTDGSANE